MRVAYKNVTKGGVRGGVSKAEVYFPDEVMTVTTHPPCTIDIPSVESEWVVIGGVGRGIHCVHTGKCVYMYICRCFVGSPPLQFSVLEGERNVAHQCSSSSLT